MNKFHICHVQYVPEQIGSNLQHRGGTVILLPCHLEGRGGLYWQQGNIGMRTPGKRNKTSHVFAFPSSTPAPGPNLNPAGAGSLNQRLVGQVSRTEMQHVKKLMFIK